MGLVRACPKSTEPRSTALLAATHHERRLYGMGGRPKEALLLCFREQVGAVPCSVLGEFEMVDGHDLASFFRAGVRVGGGGVAGRGSSEPWAR